MTAPAGLKRPKGPVVVEKPVTKVAAKPTVAKTSASTQSAKPKAEKESKGPSAKGLSCLCGCGQATVTDSAKFIPGHDAKLKGLLLKVERGELPKNQVPEIAKPFLQRSGMSNAWSFPTESGNTPDEDRFGKTWADRKEEVEAEKAEKAAAKKEKLAALKAKSAKAKKAKPAVEEDEEEEEVEEEEE